MRIMIVYTNYGTGHQRAAEALEKELRNRDKTLVIENLDIVSYSRPFLNKIVNRTGTLLATKLRKFRFNLYKTQMYSKMNKQSSFVNFCVAITWTKKPEKRLKEFNADLIISTQAAPIELVARHKEKIGNPKIANIFTDYGLHRYHLLSKKHIDYYFPPTEEIKNQLISFGVKKEKVFVTGIPVLEEFNPTKYKNDEITKKYCLTENKAIFLFVAGGGLGHANSLPYFEELLKINFPFSYIFVSGKNEKLRHKAELIANKSDKNGKVLGYTNDMPKLLNASNLMIGKPGGLITTECIEMNTPICAVEPIPGQELKNIEFLVNNNFGIYPKNIHEFRIAIEHILESNQSLEEMKANIENYNNKNGSKAITDTLLSFSD